MGIIPSIVDNPAKDANINAKYVLFMLSPINYIRDWIKYKINPV